MTRNYEDEADFIDIIRDNIDINDPYTLVMAAGMIASLEDHDVPLLNEMVSMLLGEKSPTTDALLLIWAQMTKEKRLAKKVTKNISRRLKDLPAWVSHLEEIYPRKVVSLQMPMGEEETFLIGVNAPRGGFTILVAIIHLGAPYIEDAYTVEDRLPAVLRHIAQIRTGEEQESILNLADARANLERYLEMTDHLWPPLETETWAYTRPVLEWMMSLMPEGGVVVEQIEYSEQELLDLTEDFLASPYAKDLDSEKEFHAHFLFDMATNYGAGDPRQWGGLLVERVLSDLAPRKIMAEPETLTGLPDTLRAVIRYSHELINASERVTQKTLETVDICEGDYLDLITEGSGGIAGMMDQAGFDPDRLFAALEGGNKAEVDQVFGEFVDQYNASLEEDDAFAGKYDWDEHMRRYLISAAGSKEALFSLDDQPLPREELTLDAVDESIAPRVKKVGDLVEKLAQDYFGDEEMTTSALRILRRAALEAPSLFVRKSSDEGFAGAVCWVAAKINDWFHQSDPERTQKKLTEVAGLKTSPAGRGETILHHLGADPQWGGQTLGDPTLLTVRKRNWMKEAVVKYF